VGADKSPDNVAVARALAAPIFDAAHYGTTADAVDLLKALTDRLRPD
jgi:electron transfer flavoprotein alpha subunit